MKKLIWILGLFIAGTSAVISYYWYQATKLPDWYTSQNQINQPSAINNTDDLIQAKTKVSPTTINSHNNNGRSVEIKLSEADINHLIILGIAKTSSKGQKIDAVKGVNTTIQNGKIETGAVVNISKLKNAQISESEKRALNKLTKTFPFLEDREVYVGVAGKPNVGEDGKLKFDDNTEIQVGNLRFPISELSNKLGIPKEQIEKRINLALKLGKVKLEDIELVDNKALIKGSYN